MEYHILLFPVSVPTLEWVKKQTNRSIKLDGSHKQKLSQSHPSVISN